MGRIKFRQRMRDAGLVAGLVACVGFVALYGGDAPAEEDEEDMETAPGAGPGGKPDSTPGAIQPLPPGGDKTQPPPLVAGPTTQLVTVPAGAEILHSGAIVASTPATLPRPRFASEYLIRKRGYIPQLVRIAPTSPAVIELELKPSTGPGEDDTPVTPDGQPSPGSEDGQDPPSTPTP